MCILLYVRLVKYSGVPEICGWLSGGTSAMDICAFFYMWHWFGVKVLQRSVVDGGYVCHGYMCILLYVTLIWCSGVHEIYGWLGGMSAMGMCAFFYMWHWFGVVVFQRSMVAGVTSAIGICAFFYMWHWFSVLVFQRSMVDYQGVHLPWVYVHSSICETYSV